MNKIYLAGGCFWGIQAYFSKIKGIVETKVGYANGLTETTNYKILKTTDHAETVEIIYDENIINLAEILERFLLVIDPYSIDKQGMILEDNIAHLFFILMNIVENVQN